MARLSLNKAQLAREAAALSTYRQFLPSLDLKRKQLMAERVKTMAKRAELDRSIADYVDNIGAEIPMLAERKIDLDGLVTVTGFTLGSENVVGVELPVLDDVTVEVAPYGYFHRPHWVDRAVQRLVEVVRLRLEARVVDLQVDALDTAIRKVTQRVNLFEQVLIPQATSNIRRINIALGDQERVAVVTSKIAKRKREAA